MSRTAQLFSAAALALFSAACGSDSNPAGGGGGAGNEPAVLPWSCEVAASAPAPDYLTRIGCKDDFEALASDPIDARIPGARSVKVIVDRLDGNKLYFQNSVKYKVHYEFASANLTKENLVVPLLPEFNRTQYYTPERRFLLAAVTYYEQPNVWALQLAAYDNMNAEMIEKLYDAVKSQVFFGPPLAFVPTSEAIEQTAKSLSKNVRIKTTDELYAGIDYQPLNLGTTVARLRFLKAADLDTEYVGARELVVLDNVPNDISVVSGLITQEFQTPLSHINVLAQNRKTPNMGLRNATKHPDLLPLEGKWVRFTVGANDWSVMEVTKEEADAYWAANMPPPVTLPLLDLQEKQLKNIEDVVDEEAGLNLKEAIKKAVLAYGAKAANYSILAKTADVPVRKAFAIPVFYYDQFMKQNGFYERVDALLADKAFQDDPKVRDTKLAELRNAMAVAPVDADFQALLRAKLEADYPNTTMRFRTSTNAEDLDGFPCAGCYESHTGDPADWQGDFLNAIRDTWAGVWFFRTFEERSYNGINHKGVGMALLVHHNFPAEEANGVALTANPFDPSGTEPGLYVNVQWGGELEVVHPPAGVTSDEFLYFFDTPNQPVTYLAHSNFVDPGATVLTRSQIYELGKALSAIHARFSPAYGPASGNNGWYAMDVEFKYDDEDQPDGQVHLVVKQARPHPGRGQ